MPLIEFKAKSQDGAISIPDTYKDWYNNTLRVFLLQEPESKPLPKKNDSTEFKRFFDEFNADLLTDG